MEWTKEEKQAAAYKIKSYGRNNTVRLQCEVTALREALKGMFIAAICDLRCTGQKCDQCAQAVIDGEELLTRIPK